VNGVSVCNVSACNNVNNTNTIATSFIDNVSAQSETSVDTSQNVGVFFKHNADLNYDKINFRTESESRYSYYIAEEKLQECPRITIKTEGRSFGHS
jgi:hypothetical protein